MRTKLKKETTAISILAFLILMITLSPQITGNAIRTAESTARDSSTTLLLLALTALALLIAIYIVFFKKDRMTTIEERDIKRLKKYVELHRGRFTDEIIKRKALEAGWRKEVVDYAMKK